jgi:hypothetical protein
MSRILLAACVLALAIRLYSQSPDCPWPGDGEPCPPGCYPAQLLGLEVVCYGIDDFHCCLEVWARYACTDKPNCLGQPCGGVARAPILTTSPAGFGECVNEMLCLRCSSYRYCGGNTIETPRGPITVFPPTVCGKIGVIVIVPIPGEGELVIPVPLPAPIEKEI